MEKGGQVMIRFAVTVLMFLFAVVTFSAVKTGYEWGPSDTGGAFAIIALGLTVLLCDEKEGK